ncbi:hypothetical protein FIBSPDRAFT_1054064 [Athelia psychrophila]|uniref:Uncharacterized protein n=1 Tax=Athelia psychrophila TaxID=1759441 RepID=A0A167VYA8_9AGAM|nr:hypothetical protein FIBSPDRAFT_1054064 [Fibularhizoctonia sp. CBS 109695]
MSHWRQTWKGMEALVKKGKAQGEVPRGDPTNSRDHAHRQPSQASLIQPPAQLLAYPKSEAIVAPAYSPLGPTNSPLLTDDISTAIAKNYGLQTSDVFLAHLRRRVHPKLVTPRTNHIDLHWYRGRRDEAHEG